MDATRGAAGPIPNTHKLDLRERVVSNVAGTIGAVVAGVFATLGAAFLTVVLANGIGAAALVGISLLAGAGIAVAAFFVFRKAVSALFEANKHGGNVSPAQNPKISPKKKTSVLSNNSIEACQLSILKIKKEDAERIGKISKEIIKCQETMQQCIENSFKIGNLSQEDADELYRNNIEAHGYARQVLTMCSNSLNQYVKAIYQALETKDLSVIDFHKFLDPLFKQLRSSLVEQENDVKNHLIELRNRNGSGFRESLLSDQVEAIINTILQSYDLANNQLSLRAHIIS